MFDPEYATTSRQPIPRAQADRWRHTARWRIGGATAKARHIVKLGLRVVYSGRRVDLNAWLEARTIRPEAA